MPAPVERSASRRGASLRPVAFAIAFGWATLAGLAACTTGLAACAPAVPRSLVELERMALLPVGRADTSSGLGRGLSDTVGTDRELLIDLFEASRDDFAHWFGAPPPVRGLRGDAAHSGSGRGAWPAFCDFEEARDFAARRGMRLPTVGEWLYAATGVRANRYPWGRQLQPSVANTLELDLRRPLPVGTFENGRSAFGCYDMLGNVWEWVEGHLPSAALISNPPLDPGARIVMGGSYLDRLRELWDVRDGPRYFAVALGSRTRGAELGVRCVVDAEDYLWRHGGEWAAHRARLVEVGRAWGPAALPLIERVRARPGAPSALAWMSEGARL